jgi:S1-C subfamily serine protease
MTEGIISALSRSLPVGETSQSGATYSIPDIIQTDAAINPGNSGGVLVDSQGQVVGVTSAIQSSTDSNSGIGFVIPSNIVNRVVPSLIKTGKYDHPWIGITGTAMNSDLAKAMNLDANQKGVLVIETASNGPAEKAGLKGSQVQNSASGQIPVGGDIITAVDGHAVDSSDDLTSYLYSNAQVGQAITLTVLRDGKEMQVQVTLGVLPNQ